MGIAVSDDERATAEVAPLARLRVLHVIIVLGETNSQYNQHCLPLMHAQDVSVCTYFEPRLRSPEEIRVFAGDGTLRGFFRALRRALDHDLDVVHLHAPQLGSLVMLALAAWPRRSSTWRKLVYTVRDSYEDYKPRNKLLMLPPLAAYRRVVFCGRAAYDSYPASWRRLAGKRARVIQNAADLERVERAIDGMEGGRGGATFTVLSIGRLEAVKDPQTLLSAFGREGEGARLVYVGAGSLEGSLSEGAEKAGLRDRVELAGLIPRDEVFRRCARADLFVSTSLGEGLPVAVIEAMATGCPAVLSDIPPHRELVGDADFVPLVPPGDAEGFAREVERFRGMTPEARVAIGTRCREHVYERFALARMLGAYDALYRELA